jgi:hypothetical protein
MPLFRLLLLGIAAVVASLNFDFVLKRNYGDEPAWEELTHGAVAACRNFFAEESGINKQGPEGQ